MNINSLFAVSFQNTWGNVRVNGKEYLLNFGEKKKPYFLLFLQLEMKQFGKSMIFFDNIFNMKAIGVNLFIKMPSDARADPSRLSSKLFCLMKVGSLTYRIIKYL